MGRSFSYECPKCAYSAKVSGGTDEGYTVAVQTILCRECRALHDAVTRVRVPDERPLLSWRTSLGLARRKFLPTRDLNHPPSFSAALNLLPYRGIPRFRWVHYRLQCPVAAYHGVEPWNDPGKCPKCGTYLEKNALPYRIWE